MFGCSVRQSSFIIKFANEQATVTRAYDQPCLSSLWLWTLCQKSIKLYIGYVADLSGSISIRDLDWHVSVIGTSNVLAYVILSWSNTEE